MRLNTLTLNNWACHGFVEADLAGGLEITGRNGTGKSSILEALRYCFASSATGFKGRVKNGERSATVKLTFSKDGAQYVVEKSLTVDKPSTALLSCDGVQVADNPSSVAASMKNVLDERVLERLLYVGQGGITGIIDQLSRRGGRQELDSLFGLDRLEKVYRKATEQLKEASVRLDVAREELAKYPEGALEGFEKTISDAQEQLGEYSGERKAESEGLEEIKKELSEAEAKFTKLTEAKKKIQENEKKLSELALEQARKSKDLEALEKGLSELAGKKLEAESLKKEKEGLTKFTEIAKLLAEKKALEEKVAEAGDLTELERQLAVARESVEANKQYATQLEATEGEVKRLSEEAAAARAKLDQDTAYFNELSSLKGQPKCPRCGQVLNKAHLFTEQQRIAHDAKHWETVIANVDAKLAGFNEAVSDLKKRVEDVNKLSAEIEFKDKELAEKRRAKNRALEDAQKLQNKLSFAGHTKETPEEVENKVARLAEVGAKLSVLDKDLTRESKLASDKSNLASALEKLVQHEGKLRSEISGLSFSEAELEESGKRKESLSKKSFEVEARIKELDFKVKEIEGKVKEVEEARKRFSEAGGKVKELDARVKLLSRAREVFHTDKGLPKFLRDKYVAKLGKLLTQYFKRFNENPDYKELSFDQNYAINVSAASGDLTADQLSGGERVQIALALRIALIEMLSPIRLLILDEPFGSLDEPHRELLGETLNRMGAGWQLVVVTHVPVESITLPKHELGGY